MEKELLRVLVIDDSEDDTLLLERELRRGEWEVTLFRVDTAEKMQESLRNDSWDIVLSDFIIPGFGGMEALKLFNSFDLDIPFILISGKISEEMAVMALQEGAQDFILKQNFTRLLPAIRRGIERVNILTEKRKTLESLSKSESLFRTLASVAPIGIIRTDTQGQCIYANKKWQEITGIDDPCLLDAPISGEVHLQKTDGSFVWILGEVAPIIENDVITGYISTATDISAEKANEERLIRQKELYSALSFTNQAIVYSETPQELFDEICRVAIENGKFNYCWITTFNPRTEEFELQSVGGGNEEFIADLKTLLNQKGNFYREGLQDNSDLIINDIDDPAADLTICHDLGKKYSIRSFANFRLCNERSACGILTFCSDQKDFFDEEIRTLLREMVGDISFALKNFEEEKWRVNAEETLLRNKQTIADLLIDTVAAIATTIEMRDPYTAGHQKRVASLACAIAQEMGMGHERIEGLRLAAQIHDVGKIQIPAEILSKPTKLSNIEFLMIKTHPETGYAILKGIEFPWPVATIIQQHHEKMDGSGYPFGLKGDNILLEARILTIADIVEAMASHRPYRPALGIDAALEAILKERGIRLDAEVVDVCISIFEEKRFYFMETK
ncbi:HD domain-containing phosphohydrolase [Sulfuricurvum sp. RIFCSPLOWO2_12_FULL_43_24]|uniref:HD domain-containing phosphohydrolase n=1 Tax=Sulfuricurvum sp. RIFCSPLOWO2_12_FULL_43_24 TaxID=1802247 RepID=UPI0008BE3DB3|nr:HD domain-containing phosphohydrolase [Sulfuricurvum sp. RIFCSPLOWO2_12_FULL_43_24]OHD84383.1 MAG: hypothetical protein A2Y52_03270 [Sulfuricurvum sp. RIFCSPLOWO2_02_43_6]OHD85302.1 MAG: hypothetical protein A3I60_05940 [Sulfuricurvum sp. RIFCSPLOWO2_02_FULL_43_45]OHD91041.1 MAG: hypothetical protein A3G19_01745 [Sulfuricurvum sp. RIFCSPLOWO2_12_FULL_43_24]